jgi:hypothetical protein
MKFDERNKKINGNSSYYYYYSPFFLSLAHELVHGRSQELLDRIS